MAANTPNITVTNKLDLINGLNVHIGGEIGRYHTIPINFFSQLAQSLQQLLTTLAKFEIITQGGIDLNNFNIELCGFQKGGAIPQFCFTKRIQTVTGGDVLEQRQFVNDRFNFLMEIASRGAYHELKEEYKGPYKRNTIVNDLYKFVNAVGTTPMSFVEVVEEQSPTTIYKVARFKAEVKNALVQKIVHATSETYREHYAYAKVKITNRGDKVRKRIQEVYEMDETVLSYAPEIITHQNTQYLLTSPLRCLFEKEKGFFIIKSELLGIIGTGETEEAAENNFAQEFDFIFNRYHQLPFSKLSAQLKKVKIMLDFLVKEKVTV